MNELETTRIAAAVNALRPDWPTTSIETLLRRPALSNRHRRDVAVALAWIACDSETRTPARVLEAGPWWAACASTEEANGPRVQWDDRCHHCHQPQLNCQSATNQALDEHEFLSHSDARRRRPAAVPMPDNVRPLLPRAAKDRREWVPETDESETT